MSNTRFDTPQRQARLKIARDCRDLYEKLVISERELLAELFAKFAQLENGIGSRRTYLEEYFPGGYVNDEWIESRWKIELKQEVLEARNIFESGVQFKYLSFKVQREEDGAFELLHDPVSLETLKAKGDYHYLCHYELIWLKLAKKIAHLQEQLRRANKNASHYAMRLLAPEKCVRVPFLVNVLKSQHYELLDACALVVPKQSDFITFIAHKWQWQDKSIPFTKADAEKLVTALENHHPNELVWLDALTPGYKNGLKLADYPRWINSCHMRITVPGPDIAVFRASPWCIAEFLMDKYGTTVESGEVSLETIMRTDRNPVTLKFKKNDWKEDSFREYLQCLVIAGTCIPHVNWRGRMARWLLQRLSSVTTIEQRLSEGEEVELSLDQVPAWDQAAVLPVPQIQADQAADQGAVVPIPQFQADQGAVVPIPQLQADQGAVEPIPQLQADQGAVEPIPQLQADQAVVPIPQIQADQAADQGPSVAHSKRMKSSSS